MPKKTAQSKPKDQPQKDPNPKPVFDTAIKKSWPELLGRNGQEAKQIILTQRP